MTNKIHIKCKSNISLSLILLEPHEDWAMGYERCSKHWREWTRRVGFVHWFQLLIQLKLVEASSFTSKHFLVPQFFFLFSKRLLL